MQIILHDEDYFAQYRFATVKIILLTEEITLHSEDNFALPVLGATVVIYNCATTENQLEFEVKFLLSQLKNSIVTQPVEECVGNMYSAWG